MWLQLDSVKLNAIPHLPDMESNPPLAQKEPTQEPDVQNKDIQVHITRSSGEVLDLPLETYLSGVIGSEMPASFEMEALKAQSVAARTFVCKRNYQVDDTTASQVYHSEDELKEIWKEGYEANHQRIQDALEATQGEVLTYDGSCITAAFFSSSNGQTNNVEEYWDGELPYLRSVDSHWDVEEAGNQKEVDMTPLVFAQTLGFENPIQNFGEVERYANGYVKQVTMDGLVFSGREMREKLSLRSSAFQLEVSADNIHIITKGYGHGIGMSQYGAQAMAKEGSNYQDILFHYYTDVKIDKLNV